jgi:hypothetical protein
VILLARLLVGSGSKLGRLATQTGQPTSRSRTLSLSTRQQPIVRTVKQWPDADLSSRDDSITHFLAG